MKLSKCIAVIVLVSLPAFGEDTVDPARRVPLRKEDTVPLGDATTYPRTIDVETATIVSKSGETHQVKDGGWLSRPALMHAAIDCKTSEEALVTHEKEHTAIEPSTLAIIGVIIAGSVLLSYQLGRNSKQ